MHFHFMGKFRGQNKAPKKEKKKFINLERDGRQTGTQASIKSSENSVF